MRKISILVTISLAIFVFAGCSNEKDIDNEIEAQSAKINRQEIESATEEEETVNVNDIYENLYLGEMFTSGAVYIEPFSMDRSVLNEEIEFNDYPYIIQFCLIEDSEVITYSAEYDSKFSFYVPENEEGSRYFNQGFSSPTQYGLCYQSHKAPSESSVGIALFNYEITKSDFTVKGEKRPYSESEYEAAKAQIEKDQELDDSDRILEALTLEDTIIGAEQICVMTIKEFNMEMMISTYITHGFEYVSKVYVVDFIKDGKVVKTFEKYNSDGPY